MRESRHSRARGAAALEATWKAKRGLKERAATGAGAGEEEGGFAGPPPPAAAAAPGCPPRQLSPSSALASGLAPLPKPGAPGPAAGGQGEGQEGKEG